MTVQKVSNSTGLKEPFKIQTIQAFITYFYRRMGSVKQLDLSVATANFGRGHTYSL